ncbi:MAG: protein kinase domain-containing protein [Terriglobales bacterium]
MAIAPGTTLGRYEIIAPLGAGGMGEVFRARDRHLQRDVAVKVLPERLTRDAIALARFQSESRALAALSHPNLLIIYDVGQQEGVTYAVTELLEGETMRARLAHGPMAWREGARLGAELAEALAAAHERGIIHRDLKPENVFLTRGGRVKLLDFGLAHMDSDDALSAATALTVPGAIAGTPGYLSPEQARGEPVTPATDIFSFGCVLYEVLTGQRRFSGPTFAACLTAVLQNAPAPVSPDLQIPPELERLTGSCLEKDPARRPQSARDLGLRLEALRLSSDSVIRAMPLPAAAAGVHTRDSLAVLPWVNQGGDADADYLCEGVPENIMNTLARLKTLRVVPRSLAFRKRAGEPDPVAIGQELNVRAILSGRLQQRGQMLIASIELTEVASGSQIWGERLRHPLGDLFALETEIADKVCTGLRMQLSGEEQQRRERRQPVSAEAYQLYLRGRQECLARTPQGLAAGAALMQQAIDLDPSYALAYAGLSECLMLAAVTTGVTPREHFARGRAAAAAAVSLDAELPEGHAALARALGYGAWLWEPALQEVGRALELDNRSGANHYLCAQLLICVGRVEEAYEHGKLAAQYEPLEPLSRYLELVALCHLRRDAETVARCEQAIADGLEHFYVLAIYGVALAFAGRAKEGAAALERATATAPTPWGLANFVWVLAAAGEHERARAVGAPVVQPMASHLPDVPSTALVYLAWGESDRALAAIETTGLASGGTTLAFYHPDRRWDSLRATPQWQAAMRRLNVPSAGWTD